MHYLFLLLPEIQDRVRRTERLILRTKEEFEQADRDGLIEYAQYVENYYGTPRKYVEEQLSQEDVILEIEIQGA